MTRAETYAAQFATLNEEIIGTIAPCTEADWGRACASEKRKVGVVAHHIANTTGNFVGIFAGLDAGGQGVPNVSAEGVDQMNAEHAATFDTVGKEETLALLRANGAALTAAIAALTDAQLDLIAGIFGGHELTVSQVVEWVLIGHFQEHLADIRATIAA